MLSCQEVWLDNGHASFLMHQFETLTDIMSRTSLLPPHLIWACNRTRRSYSVIRFNFVSIFTSTELVLVFVSVLKVLDNEKNIYTVYLLREQRGKRLFLSKNKDDNVIISFFFTTF